VLLGSLQSWHERRHIHIVTDMAAAEGKVIQGSKPHQTWSLARAFGQNDGYGQVIVERRL
jgi:hypothetical protein